MQRCRKAAPLEHKPPSGGFFFWTAGKLDWGFFLCKGSNKVPFAIHPVAIMNFRSRSRLALLLNC
jgi:hypothetical protein